jgi:hypothetical protein
VVVEELILMLITQGVVVEQGNYFGRFLILVMEYLQLLLLLTPLALGLLLLQQMEPTVVQFLLGL